MPERPFRKKPAKSSVSLPPIVPGQLSWHSRGYLPHFDIPGLIQGITFRLHDAVPEHLVEEWKMELGWAESLPSSDPRKVALRTRIAKYEDAGYGACWLREPKIAALVEGALLHFDGARYHLIAWVIMPNHVHAIIETLGEFLLEELAHSWKSFTAKEANKVLGRSGAFWFRDYYDRYARDDEHLDEMINYIENNPVKARFVDEAELWPYSSARWRTG